MQFKISITASSGGDSRLGQFRYWLWILWWEPQNTQLVEARFIFSHTAPNVTVYSVWQVAYAEGATHESSECNTIGETQQEY